VDFFTDDDPIRILSKGFQCAVDLTMIGDCDLVQTGGLCCYY